ncbi:hypothetical protein [Vibrio owensii]|uniref:hypothetical protein n=1 Tax=Vibrio owensii TaxID=696485 RepID=UPI003CC65088
MKSSYISYAVHGLAALTTCFALFAQVAKIGTANFSLPLSLLIVSIFGIHVCAFITKRKMLSFQARCRQSDTQTNSQTNIFSSQVTKLKQVKLGLKLTKVLVSDLCCAVIVFSLNIIALTGDISAAILFEYGTIIVLGLINLMFVIADNQDKALERQAKLVSLPESDNLLLSNYLSQMKKAA